MIPHSPNTASLKRDRLSIISLAAINKKRREGSLADIVAQQQEDAQPEFKMLEDTRIDTSCIPKAWLEVGFSSKQGVIHEYYRSLTS